MFNLMPTKEFSFSSLDEMLAFVAEEKRRIRRGAIKDCWASYKRFSEDAFFGDSREQLTFNERGFRDLLNLIGIPEQIIFGIRKQRLATEIINDFIERILEEKEKLEAAEFIYDASEMIIIGVNSKHSLGSNNEEFLRTILSALDNRNINAIFPFLENFRIISGRSINTKLRLSLASNRLKSACYSNRTRCTQIYEIGFQFTNDVIIGNTTRIDMLVYNPAKDTKLLLPMLGSAGQFTHYGNSKKYIKQLQDSTVSGLKQLERVGGVMEKLAVTLFSADTIATHADIKNIFSIPVGRHLQDTITRKFRDRDYSILIKRFATIAKNADRLTLLCELLELNDAERIFKLDKKITANMCDFVELFINYAQLLPTEQRDDIERNIGNFVNWFDQNSRKFKRSES